MNIPIDIHTNKLLDWLISRRHVKREWQAQVLIIREKINNAIQDMPVHEEIAKLLSGSYINYYHCKKIIEILKETEAKSKNFFGSYGSQRMKDWQEIVKLYENDNVYLAEAAQMLIRNANYEVPSLKKQIAKCEQLQTECARKTKEYTKNASLVRGEFDALCRQLGIPGQCIKRELVERLTELPAIYQLVADNAKGLGPAVEFYSAFVKLVLGDEHFGGCIAAIKYMIEHGNTTTYEWMYGEPPLKIEEPELNINLDDEADENANSGIDFGEVNGGDIDFGAVSDVNGSQIDFGDVTLEESGDIDWGNLDGVDASASTNNPQEIDFNILSGESGIVVEADGVDGGVARGEEALSMLDNPKTRTSFVDELMELQMFLKMRLLEMQGANDLLSLSQLQEAPTILQLQTTESVRVMLDSVNITIRDITDARTQHLYNIKNSPRYVDHLVEGLRQKQAVAKRMDASCEAVNARRRELGEEARALQPKLRLIIDKTHELQAQIEQDISQRYQSRPVNIMGQVNML